MNSYNQSTEPVKPSGQENTELSERFAGLYIALPESRQLDVLANLFRKRGASLLRCPLVSIHDSPNRDLIEAWLKDFIASPPDILVVLTGEGIKRLTGFAERATLLDGWVEALSKVHILARGPKPNRALKVLGLQASELGVEPTTEGIIKSLDKKNLDEKIINVQLYGEDPNSKLQNYLKGRSVIYKTVSPYIYASDIETDSVVNLIEQLTNNKVDIICFTSKAQYSRLESVARKYSIVDSLVSGLKQTKIIAIGPVVAEQLKQQGYKIAAMPEEKYFMKPMVNAVENLLTNSKIN